MFWGPNNSLARAPKGQQIIFRVQGPRVQDSWPDLFLSCQNSCQLLFISCAADVNIMSNEVVLPFLYESLLSSLSLIFTMLCICMCVCVCVCVLQEVLESCQTRVSKLELQQQQNQTVQVENADAKVLLGKCINIMLAIVTVILVCVSTAAKFTAPLLRSRVHLALTCVGLSVLALLWKNWEHLQCALERLVLPHWWRSTSERFVRAWGGVYM